MCVIGLLIDEYSGPLLKLSIARAMKQVYTHSTHTACECMGAVVGISMCCVDVLCRHHVRD